MMELQPHQVPVHAIQNELAFLVMHGRPHRDDAGGLLWCEFGDSQRWIQRVAGENAFEVKGAYAHHPTSGALPAPYSPLPPRKLK